MSFLSVFKSQVPNIIVRLQAVKDELSDTQADIGKLLKLEQAASIAENNYTWQHGRVDQMLGDWGVAVWLKDLNGRFLYVNKKCCESILHCTKEEALGLTNGDLKKDVLASVCMESDRQIIKKQRTIRFIEFAIYPDGHQLWIDTIKSPAYEDNKLFGVVGNAINITERIPRNIKQDIARSGSAMIPTDATICEDLIEELFGGESCRKE